MSESDTLTGEEKVASDDDATGLPSPARSLSCRPYARDAVLGINDGLVSLFLLAVTFVASNRTNTEHDVGHDILVACLAAALGGSLSMGIGEYQATKSQQQIYEAETHAFQRELLTDNHAFRDIVHDHLRRWGLSPVHRSQIIDMLEETNQGKWHFLKSVHLGMTEGEKRYPGHAMCIASLSFLVGSLPVVLPFVVYHDVDHGLYGACVLTALMLLWTGAVKAHLVGQSIWRGMFENVFFGTACAGVSWLFGYLLSLGTPTA